MGEVAMLESAELWSNQVRSDSGGRLFQFDGKCFECREAPENESGQRRAIVLSQKRDDFVERDACRVGKRIAVGAGAQGGKSDTLAVVLDGEFEAFLVGTSE